jgi:hypothetical protein
VKPAPYSDVHAFCRIDGWVDADAEAGRRQGDHTRYRRLLGNGEILRTKVSHGQGEYSGNLWRHILRDQLRITAAQFWETLRTGEPPERPEDKVEAPEGNRLPYWLVDRLMKNVGLSECVIGDLTEAEALERWREWQRRQRR